MQTPEQKKLLKAEEDHSMIKEEVMEGRRRKHSVANQSYLECKVHISLCFFGP